MNTACKEKKTTEKNSAPLQTCLFSRMDSVAFALKDGQETNGFSIIGYSGEIITNHWYWGNLAFDLKGLRFAKDQIPVLEEHFDRIGFTTKQEITDKVLVEGEFLNNPDAQQLKNDMKQGFPMEASLYIPPEIIETVEQGASVQVNGKTLNGPGTVFRKAVIKEVSMCVFGADSNTKSMAFAGGEGREVKFNIMNKENPMADEKPTLLNPKTLEQFATDEPVLFEQAVAKGKEDGEKGVRAEFAAFAEMFKDDPAFCIAQFAKGASLDDAVAAENAKLKQQIADKDKKGREVVDPAKAEFSDKADGKPAVVQTDEQRFTDEFNKSKAIQDEFGQNGLRDYIAYRTADEKKLIRVKKQ